MQSEIEQLGYVVVVRPVRKDGAGSVEPDAAFEGIAFCREDWRRDRRIVAPTAEDAMEMLHALIVPRNGREPPKLPPLPTPLPDRVDLI